jgi:deoxyribodipyrimidine photolyase-related protein
MTTRCHTLRLVLGDQLNPRHSWFDHARRVVVYRADGDPPGDRLRAAPRAENPRHLCRHARRSRASCAMPATACTMWRSTTPDNRQSLPGQPRRPHRALRRDGVRIPAPDEWRLDAQLQDWAQRQAIPCVDGRQRTLPDRPATEAAELFAGRKQWLMEHFYRHMRRATSVLLDDAGSPKAGSGTSTTTTASPGPALPPDLPIRPQHDHSRPVGRRSSRAGVRSFGEPSGTIRWPLNRDEALRQLDALHQHALPHFGDYQDALSRRRGAVPLAAVVRAEREDADPRGSGRTRRGRLACGRVPLAAAEGFIRQILGWREYVRGVYWAHMPGYDEHNALGHTLPLPGWFWTGETPACAAWRTPSASRCRHAYAHHIQRLMVIGNFALLAGLDPAGVHRWYLGVYIDAFEWVEVPNTWA